MLIEYDKESVFTKQLEIEDLGNCALCCRTEDAYEYYILVRTVFGKASILKYGPLVPDIEQLPEFFNLSYQKIDYNIAKIEKIINTLVNDEKKGIIEVEEDTIENILTNFPSIADLFMKME